MPVRLAVFSVQGLAPDGRGTEEFSIDADHREWLRANGPEWKYYDAGMIPELLRNPTSIFRGLKRQGFAQALCYCGKPATIWVDDQVDAQAPAGMVFVAYIVRRPGDVWLVWDWDWVPEDITTPGHPDGWQDRYEERTWPRS